MEKKKKSRQVVKNWDSSTEEEEVPEDVTGLEKKFTGGDVMGPVNPLEQSKALLKSAEDLLSEARKISTENIALSIQKCAEVKQCYDQAEPLLLKAGDPTDLQPLRFSLFTFWGGELMKQAHEDIDDLIGKHGFLPERQPIADSGEDPIAVIDSILVDASAKLQSAIDIDPDSVAVLQALGECMLSRGNLHKSLEADKLFAQAAATYEEACSKKDTLDTLWAGWGDALMKRAQLRKKKIDEKQEFLRLAGEKYQRMFELQPNHANKEKLATLYCYEGKELASKAVLSPRDKIETLDRSISQLKRALQLMPDSVEALEGLGRSLQIYAEESKPKERSWYMQLGQEAISTGKWLAAREAKGKKEKLTVRKFGYLSKTGKVRGKSERRFFILTDKSLAYYSEPGGKKKGEIKFKGGNSVEGLTSGDAGFAITSGKKKTKFLTLDDEEAESWRAKVEFALMAKGGGDSGKGKGKE